MCWSAATVTSTPRTVCCRHVQALLAAGRGGDDTTRAFTDEMKSGQHPAGPDHTDERLAGTGLAALGSGDFEEAYQQVAAEDSERGSERAP